ncbi:Superfamily II DNA and RNA helicase [Pseudomonas cannabina pv. alisalensis]|nr:Superfamily II DNA and RNA helicase [Pseudomonas cannabina pv. alisalensis]
MRITRYTATPIPRADRDRLRLCMKFRFLLWVLGLLMARASRNNPAFQQQLAGKNLTFQLQTADGRVARHFVVQDQRIRSASGVVAEPAFAISFRDAAFGFATLQAKNKQLAFMKGIQDKDIQIKGNPALVIWFQGLTKYLKPKKKVA